MRVFGQLLVVERRSSDLCWRETWVGEPELEALWAGTVSRLRGNR